MRANRLWVMLAFAGALAVGTVVYAAPLVVNVPPANDVSTAGKCSRSFQLDSMLGFQS